MVDNSLLLHGASGRAPALQIWKSTSSGSPLTLGVLQMWNGGSFKSVLTALVCTWETPLGTTPPQVPHTGHNFLCAQCGVLDKKVCAQCGVLGGGVPQCGVLRGGCAQCGVDTTGKFVDKNFQNYPKNFQHFQKISKKILDIQKCLEISAKNVQKFFDIQNFLENFGKFWNFVGQLWKFLSKIFLDPC